MSAKFQGWAAVRNALLQMAAKASATERGWSLNEGQRRSIRSIASRIGRNGVIVADEVGMGKTRIAVALAQAVTSCGGRVAILIPPGLGYQWQDELRDGGVACAPLLRSLQQFYGAWSPGSEEKPWPQQQVMLLSHALANWRRSDASDWWRWGLLPELIASLQQVRSRLPNGYADFARSLTGRWLAPEVRAAAIDIAKAVAADGYLSDIVIQAVDGAAWRDTLQASAYTRAGRFRIALERAVGFGLGTFDLIVVDEAHKSRGVESGLARLLGLVVGSSACRRLAMTATPVELDATQWMGALQRIGADTAHLKASIESYAKAAREIRSSPTVAAIRHRYAKAAVDFHTALKPFLLRRDKRESTAVQQFSRKSGLPLHAYRREAEIAVDPRGMSVAWRRAVCAAEALSLAASGGRDPAAQRLRLTIGNGHGINELIDRATRDADDDRAQTEHDTNMEKSEGAVMPAPAPDLAQDKRSQRIAWWKGVVHSAFADGSNDALFEHPGIAAAIQTLEAADLRQEKVLVFGRYTRPMRALVDLLNARKMLMCVSQGVAWPQASVHEQEWPAVQAAQLQLDLFVGQGRAAIDARLREQYDALERARQSVRDGLLPRLEQGLSALRPDGLAFRMFDAMKRSKKGVSSVARALTEMLGDEARGSPPLAWAMEFDLLVQASAERDEGDENGDGALDDAGALALWNKLSERLDQEYSRPEGGFARLMYGKTEHSTRRLLQMAFNRPHSYPRVLVAQSVVGREGLNLHRACRTVVLLHPEWNPAVVEQQIGRVDRVGSRFEQLVATADEKVWQESPPRIDVLPIVFKGTYDEHQWTVLRERWSDLRAQLHGVVIPPSVSDRDELLGQLAQEINGMAPDFSPRD